ASRLVRRDVAPPPLRGTGARGNARVDPDRRAPDLSHAGAGGRAGARSRGARELPTMGARSLVPGTEADARPGSGAATHRGARALSIRSGGGPGVLRAVRLARGRRPFVFQMGCEEEPTPTLDAPPGASTGVEGPSGERAL